MPDEIERIIRRDIDRLPLFPEERWVPAQPPRSTTMTGLGRAVAVALVLVVAVASGSALARLRSDAVPSGVTDPGGSAAKLTGPPAAPPAFHAAAGFDLRLPPGWSADDRTDVVGRRSQRLLVVSNNGALPPPQTGAGVDWSAVPTNSVVLELLESGSPGGPGPETESVFPLDWNQARPVTGSAVRQLDLQFQHLLRPLTLSAHLGPTASAADVERLRQLVASIRPEPLPVNGVYRGWDILGPLESYPVGTVRHVEAHQPSGMGYFLVRGARTVMAHIDQGYLFMGAMRPCPIRYDAAARTFVCDATGDRWSRTGRLLGGLEGFALGWHVAFVKDGLVLVAGGSANGGGPRPDEQAEFGDAVPPLARPTSVLSRQEVLQRYARLTSTEPILRSAAKLVPTSQLSTVVGGALSIPAGAEKVWVVAFSGDVRIAGGGASPGRWTVFAADAYTGGVLTAACCGQGGDWPAGFDALPDLAPD